MQKPELCATGLCPVKAIVDVIGGRWKPSLLYFIMSETRRFNELRRLIPGATQRMLTLQLRELEADGVVYRHVYARVPPKSRVFADALWSHLGAAHRAGATLGRDLPRHAR